MENTLPTFCSLTKLFCLIDFTDCIGDKGNLSDMQVRPLRVSILWPTAGLCFSLENLLNSAAMSSKASFIKRMAAIYLAWTLFDDSKLETALPLDWKVLFTSHWSPSFEVSESNRSSQISHVKHNLCPLCHQHSSASAAPFCYYL